MAEDLGVRYVLEGSVRRAGDQVRINAQLIDAVSGGHLWADRYDGSLADVFALQDEVIGHIVAALEVELSPSEAAALRTKGTSDPAAYDAFLKGVRYANDISLYTAAEPNMKARQAFQNAIDIDPQYADAYAGLGWASWLRFAFIDPTDGRAKATAFDMANKSLEIRDNALAHRVLAKQYLPLNKADFLLPAGYFHEVETKPHDLAVVELRKAVTLEPNNPDMLADLAYTLVYAGEPTEAVDLMRQSETPRSEFPRLVSPTDRTGLLIRRRLQECDQRI